MDLLYIIFILMSIALVGGIVGFVNTLHSMIAEVSGTSYNKNTNVFIMRLVIACLIASVILGTIHKIQN